MQAETIRALVLALLETWCIEGVVLRLNFRKTGKAPDPRKLIITFLWVNALTNLPLNLILAFLGSRMSQLQLLIYLTIMEGAAIPLCEAVLYRKTLRLRSMTEWAILSYEMNLASYTIPILLAHLKEVLFR